MTVQRGYKVKIYPTKAQEQRLLQTFGACRWVYNRFLEAKKVAYFENGKNLTYNQMSKELTKLRRKTDWLQEVQFQPLQQSLRQLDVAYNRFFRKQSRFPNFKGKYAKQSFRKPNRWSVKGNRIYVMRGLSVRFRGKFPEKREGTLTISRDRAGSWFASAQGYEERKQPKLKGSVGIDLGLKDLAITSEGQKFDNIRSLDGLAKRIKSAQQALSRKKKGSKNRAKAKLVLARLHKKVENKRKNHLHHVSREIVDKNHATVAVEDLAVKNMMKNGRLARSIGDASWGELLRQISYKQEWLGGKVVKIGRFFPSSKTCSACNFVLAKLPLNIRQWECPRCHESHDRDINAAKVILKQAGELLGVEGGDGSRRIRPAVRVTRPMKHGYSS